MPPDFKLESTGRHNAIDLVGGLIGRSGRLHITGSSAREGTLPFIEGGIAQVTYASGDRVQVQE